MSIMGRLEKLPLETPIVQQEPERIQDYRSPLDRPFRVGTAGLTPNARQEYRCPVHGYIGVATLRLRVTDGSARSARRFCLACISEALMNLAAWIDVDPTDDNA